MASNDQTDSVTLPDFLLARFAEDLAELDDPTRDYPDTDVSKLGIDLDAKCQIVKWHKAWPVLVQRPPTFEAIDNGDPSSIAMRASQQMAWLTEQEYRDRFGEEPPAAPVLRFLALPYADHPDYRPEWKP